VKGFQSGGVVLVVLDKGHHVPLCTKEGGIHTLFAYGVDEIVTDVSSSLDQEVVASFPQVCWE
jgi:hypothetical protein